MVIVRCLCGEPGAFWVHQVFRHFRTRRTEGIQIELKMTETGSMQYGRAFRTSLASYQSYLSEIPNASFFSLGHVRTGVESERI